MVVLIVNKLPPAVRGRLKLWFIEPKPNVFISCVKGSVAEAIIQELWEVCPFHSGMLVIRSTNTTQGYSIETRGEPTKDVVRMCGLTMIQDNKPSTI